MTTDSAPCVVPGEVLVLELKNRRYYLVNKYGRVVSPARFLKSRPFEATVVEVDDCEHGETVCPECVHEWAIDYYVEIKSELVLT